jgi:hypothetical protein
MPRGQYDRSKTAAQRAAEKAPKTASPAKKTRRTKAVAYGAGTKTYPDTIPANLLTDGTISVKKTTDLTALQTHLASLASVYVLLDSQAPISLGHEIEVVAELMREKRLEVFGETKAEKAANEAQPKAEKDPVSVSATVVKATKAAPTQPQLPMQVHAPVAAPAVPQHQVQAPFPPITA